MALQKELQLYESLSYFSLRVVVGKDLNVDAQFLQAADLDPAQKNRWILAYLLYGDIRSACAMSEKRGFEFYNAMKVRTTGLPRGTERKSFRGAVVNSVRKELQRTLEPENFLSFVDENRNVPFAVSAYLNYFVRLFIERERRVYNFTELERTNEVLAATKDHSLPGFSRGLNRWDALTILKKYDAFREGNYEHGQERARLETKLQSFAVQSTTLAFMRERWKEHSRSLKQN